MGQAFGEGYGGGLGDGVRRCADLTQKTGRRCGANDVAFAAGQHPGQDRTGRVNMGHEVDLPDLLPIFVGCGGRAFGIVVENARVGEEEVDVAKLALGAFDNFDVVVFLGHVGVHGDAADVAGDAFRAFLVAVDDHHGARAFFGETAAEALADSAGATGNNGHFIFDIHDSFFFGCNAASI